MKARIPDEVIQAQSRAGTNELLDPRRHRTLRLLSLTHLC